MGPLTALLIAAAGPTLPAWMAGCWVQQSENRWTEECWSAPRGGMMIGYSRSGEGGVLSEWEVMQIVHEETDDPAVDKLRFWASPGGAKRTMFSWVPDDKAGLTFFNLENDYPQRIRYWREGADLMAEIALKDGSKPQRWRYSRKPN
jgi:Domain of unknown function (DUF6265)